MNMPRFTAEVSLYKTSQMYRGAMQGSPTALTPSLGLGIDLFPPIRCCGFVPMLQRFVCVTRRASPLEQCRCTRDFFGFPVILCRPPVNAPPQ